MGMKSLAVAAILGLAMGVGPAAAQDVDYNQQVRTYLDAVEPRHAAEGHRAVRGAEMVVALNNGTAKIWPVQLRRGVNYVIFGACDDDCSDVDMEIYDADGLLVDTDVASDDTPFVQITPESSGRGYVRIWLASCSQEPCYVGARVMSGGNVIQRTAVAEMPEDGPPYAAHVRAILDRSSTRHTSAGFTQSADRLAAVRLEGDGHRETVAAQAGRRYRVQAACDQDCSDIDIEILDPAGQQVATDVAFDNNPFVEFTATQTGAYTARVWLVTCSVEPCFVGVRTFEAGQ